MICGLTHDFSCDFSMLGIRLHRCANKTMKLCGTFLTSAMVHSDHYEEHRRIPHGVQLVV